MKKNTILLFFVLLYFDFSFCQPIYTTFKFEPPGQYETYGTLGDTAIGPNPSIVYWNEYIKSYGLQVLAFDTLTAMPFELYLQGLQIQNEYENCIAQWNYNGCLTLDLDYYGIPAFFSNDAMLFSPTAYATTLFAVDKPSDNYFFELYPSQSLTQYFFTRIVLNNTSNFSKTWTTTEANIGEEYVPIKAILLHELGHLVGLSHIYNDDAYNPVMLGYHLPNQFVFNLTGHDKEALQQLCALHGTPTGIEDYIWITEDLDHYDVGQTYVGHIDRNFVDVSPYGDYIVTWDDWQIKASYGCGEVLVYQTSGGAIYITSMPSGYLWERDENGYVIGTLSTGGTDNDGVHHTASMPIKIGNVPNTFITSGTLTSDTTYWCGEIALTGSITVPTGKTLRVYPGAIIRFPTNVSLIVNGKLDAEGCTFISASGSSPSSWGTIKLNGSGASGSFIKFANIYYGTQVEADNVPDFEISNCNFTDNYKAVYANNSSGTISGNQITSSSIGHVIQIENGSTVDCKNNVITKSNNRGFAILYSGGSSGYVTANDINGCDVGIGAIWSSSPSSYSATYLARNNRIRYCNDGLKVYRNSSVTFGTPPSGNNDAKNSICQNTRNVSVATWYTSYPATLIAASNWWGSNPPNTSLFSLGTNATFTYIPPLSSDPWVGIPKAGIKNIAAKISAEPIDSVDPGPIYYGTQLRLQKKYKEAKDFFISYIAEHPDDQCAYVELYNCYSKETSADLINFFQNLPASASKDHKLLLSYLYLRESRNAASEAVRKTNVALAKKTNNSIIKENPNTSLSVRAKINNIYIALYSENDLAKVSSIFAEIANKTQLSTEMELADVKDAIDIYAGVFKSRDNGSNSPGVNKDNTLLETPKEYSLLGNYPNPFNPSTTISYNLPTASEVEVTIYDILGNEVKSFVIPAQNSGTQEIIWNGKNSNGEQVASGIYLYHLKAVSLKGKNQVFEKSAKLILMK